MKRWGYWIVPALFCISLHAAAQDKKADKDFDESEWRVIDTAESEEFQEGNLDDVYADTAVDAPAIDTTPFTESTTDETEAATETDDERTIEQKIREGDVAYSHWDRQPLGDWDESGQARLSPRKVPVKDMEELRNMSALDYTKDDHPDVPKRNATLDAIGAWVRANGSVFLWIFYITLGLLLVAVLVLFIRKNDISFRWSSGNNGPHGGFGAKAEEGPQNYETLAASAIADGRLRDAVRFRYLHSLQLLEARELIAPGKDKTNMDFLRELSRTAFHKPFAALTLHYEYVWYGKAPLSNGQFSLLDDQFAAFTQSIKQHS